MTAGTRVRSVLTCLLLSLLVSAPPLTAEHNVPQSQTAHPKNDYALIYGTVWGPDNHPVAGIPIKIQRASGKKHVWELQSDHSGEFAQRVPAGKQDYIVVADIKVKKGQQKPQVTVHIDDDERQDISLHLSAEELSSR